VTAADRRCAQGAARAARFAHFAGSRPDPTWSIRAAWSAGCRRTTP